MFREVIVSGLVGASFRIVEGLEYEYTADKPEECNGHRYRVVCLAKTAPQYQKVVVTVGLTGPDEGLHYVCTYFNFASRFKLIPGQDVQPLQGGNGHA
jgi:hypothetical protein